MTQNIFATAELLVINCNFTSTSGYFFFWIK